MNPDIIKNGFKKDGIVPFNNNVISDEQYDVEALERWKAMQKVNNSDEVESQNIPQIVIDMNIYTINEISAVPSISSNLSIDSIENKSIFVEMPPVAQDGPSTSSSVGTPFISFESLLLKTLKSSANVVQQWCRSNHT